MATILLSAAGAALGAGFGGTVLGLSGAVIGRAVGATLGRVIDQRIQGAGSEAVEVGKVDRFRLTGAGEGAAIARAWGRARLAGQVIWASRFQDSVVRSGGGKGSPRPTTVQHSYTVSLAIALCEGEIRRIGRIWADGNEISADRLVLRVYTGSQTQLPDPKMEAVEGAGQVPAYRGLAYVVIEDLELSAFGNRVPQFSFEVVRAAQPPLASGIEELARTVPGVCLIPGTGEYALATTPVYLTQGLGRSQAVNVNSASGKTDFVTSVEQLLDEMPQTRALSLVVSWFGDDLRCGDCTVRPKVEQVAFDAAAMPWSVAGLTRAAATVVPQIEGRAVYGGTPTDRSVIDALTHVKAEGFSVTFYPFMLMDQIAGNALVDPWTGTVGQPQLPWRGRITTALAPGLAGTPDRSAAADAQVAAFFGSAQAADFSIAAGVVSYSGPPEWSYRRFILHNAALCVAAGGVDAFCIGSEMRGLTQIRGAGDSFPAVAALRALAAEVRSLVGPGCKLTYAADWSEYFGYHAGDNVYFHLDPLWADANIDFIGIDNYMPLADWRAGETHADSLWGDPRNPDYLQANIAGGEGFDWYYNGPEGLAAQLRTPIADQSVHGEDWVFRYKDLLGWWSNPHHDRIAGVRQPSPTAWVPQSKPFRFTEFGCGAVDKGANQPNRFLDLKSSESGLPNFSAGQRDDLQQMAYFSAMAQYWRTVAHNPVSAVYGGPMLDFENSTAWAWDARPFPAFPAHETLWSDAGNFETGHWLNGRVGNQPLGAVIAEICAGAGLPEAQAEQAFGIVRGYGLGDLASARVALQPLLQAAAVDVIEREGILRFENRTGFHSIQVDSAAFALPDAKSAAVEATRLSEADLQTAVRLTYMADDGSFTARSAEAKLADQAAEIVGQSDLPLALTAAEAQGLAERWLHEGRVARDMLRFALPPSQRALGAGDTVQVAGVRYRIDRCELRDLQEIEAVRIEPGLYAAPLIERQPAKWQGFAAPTPPYPVFLDLPLLTGAEVEHAPHLAVTSAPWGGQVAVWNAVSDAGYALNTVLDAPAVIGETEIDLPRAAHGRWNRTAVLRVRLVSGSLSSADEASVLAGANTLALGDGSAENWEILQFATATLVAPNTYDLSDLLRGQLGSDAVMPDIWPTGSQVVLLDDRLRQIDLPASARGLQRHYRIGLANRGYDTPETVLRVQAFAGIGLRPYAVCHLRPTGAVGQDIALTWVRRSRIDGDNWTSVEVPLGEEGESYRVQVFSGTTQLREVFTSQPSWTYSLALQTADMATSPLRCVVSQMSARFGPGPTRQVTVV